MIYNLGSINADLFYSVQSLPQLGETLSATDIARDLGGKGANMSIAAARAGGRVYHIGAVGQDGRWMIETLKAAGIETHISVLSEVATGHAVILRDAKGGNAIVTVAGANLILDETQVQHGLENIESGDIFLFQNETNLGARAARLASEAGAHVVYAAAPFCAQTVKRALGLVDTLVLNSVEMSQLQVETGLTSQALGIDRVIVTEGAAGATLFSSGQDPRAFPAPKVDAVDTTGAGDTFTGFFCAGLDAEQGEEAALKNAILAASLMTTKKGTASAIPSQADVDQFSAMIL